MSANIYFTHEALGYTFCQWNRNETYLEKNLNPNMQQF